MNPSLSSNNNWPLVSIVTPSFNQARYLEETIRSVLSQDYPSIEYLIIDGGSTDGSVEIIRQYADQLAYWISEPDDGQSDAINKGFRRARGEFVAWINSDDTYNPGAIGQAVETFLAHPETAMVYSDCYIIDDESRLVQTLTTFDYDLSTAVLETKIPQQTVFMRATALRDVGFLDTSLHYVMDCDLWLRLGIKYSIRRIPGVLANFRAASGTKTSENWKQFGLELLHIYQRFFSNPDLPSEIQALESRVFARIHWRTGIELCAAGDWQQGISHCIRAVTGLYDVFDDNDYAVNRLIHGPDARQSGLRDPLLIKCIIRELPLSWKEKSRRKQQVWSRYAAARFFADHANASRIEVLFHGVWASVLDASWLRNRGFLSIFARSLLGSKVFEYVKLPFRSLLS